MVNSNSLSVYMLNIHSVLYIQMNGSCIKTWSVFVYTDIRMIRTRYMRNDVLENRQIINTTRCIITRLDACFVCISREFTRLWPFLFFFFFFFLIVHHCILCRLVGLWWFKIKWLDWIIVFDLFFFCICCLWFFIGNFK